MGIPVVMHRTHLMPTLIPFGLLRYLLIMHAFELSIIKKVNTTLGSLKCPRPI
jgi:hypothetical protein